jgi:hypothetical protein
MHRAELLRKYCMCSKFCKVVIILASPLGWNMLLGRCNSTYYMLDHALCHPVGTSRYVGLYMSLVKLQLL